MALNQFKEFTNQTIDVDGQEYRTCTFTDCVLVFSGGNPPMFDDCIFFNTDPRLTGCAENTIGFLANLWRAGNIRYIEAVFASIRSINGFPDRSVN
jgi:hypothetical protein